MEKKSPLDDIPPEDLANMALDMLRNFHTIGEIHGLDEDNLEAMYAAAFNYYNHGKFQEAHDLFRCLSTMNHLEPKYVMGLAACKQMMKQWEAAIDCYGLVMNMEPLNIMPAFHTSECLLQLDDKEGAKRALKLVIEIHDISKDKKHDAVRKQAENLLKSMNEASPDKK